MQHMRRSSLSRIVSYLVALTLLVPHLFMALPLASAQTLKQVTSVAVIPFEDQSGSGKAFVSQEMTAAAALALEDTREFTVTSTADLDRELRSMRLSPPLSKEQQGNLGERLQVERVLTGAITGLGVDSKTGSCQVDIWIMMLDVAVGEVLDGAIIHSSTKGVPGWNGDVNQAINEGMREAAQRAVEGMLSTRVRRGNVDLVDDLGFSSINLGATDGLTRDSDLLVMRPQWQPDLEKVLLRRVGVIRVKDLESNMSVCRSVEGGQPTTGDKVYRMYKPISTQKQEARSRSMKKSGTLVAALLLLLGLAGLAGGPTTSSSSSLSGGLSQARPGADPVVTLHIRSGNTELTGTHGYLMYRAANNPNFPAVADFLVDMLPGKQSYFYTDEPSVVQVVEDREITFQFFDESGDLTSGSVTASFNDLALSQGTRYYYKVRRVVDPLFPPGTNPPIGTQQVTLTTPVITTDPDERVLSDISSPHGPVTFFVPPIQSTPSNGAVNQPVQNITFTWAPTTGANLYFVEVFPNSDPDGLRAPIFRSGEQRVGSASLMNATIQGPFGSGATFWWRVGARQTADRTPPKLETTGQTGWLFSSMRSFTTTVSPPPPPSSSSTAQPKPVPDRHRGWWGGAGRSRRQ